MKNLLPSFEAVINLMDYETRSKILGENSYSQINSLYYSGQRKSFVVDITLYTKSPELLEDSYYTVYDDFIKDSWKFFGINENLIIVKSCELITD
jgi:hypothetical protein